MGGVFEVGWPGWGGLLAGLGVGESFCVFARLPSAAGARALAASRVKEITPGLRRGVRFKFATRRASNVVSLRAVRCFDLPASGWDEAIVLYHAQRRRFNCGKLEPTATGQMPAAGWLRSGQDFAKATRSNANAHNKPEQKRM